MSIVEAAKIQTAKIPYGCNGGGCGICKMRIVEGEYKLTDEAAKALSDDEKNNGSCIPLPNLSTKRLAVGIC